MEAVSSPGQLLQVELLCSLSGDPTLSTPSEKVNLHGFFGVNFDLL